MYFLPPLSASAVVFGGLQPAAPLSLPPACPPLPSPPAPSRSFPLPARSSPSSALSFPSLASPSCSAGYNPPLPSLCLLLALLCPPPPLYFSLHFLPFLPPPLSFLPSFNYFLHFFVAVLPFSSAVCAFPATNVEFSHPPLRDKLVASPIPLHFPSLSPRSLHLPLSASLRPPPP